MKLDSRILEGKKPLTCFDTEEAKRFIGKECYFSNYLCNFNNINSIAPRALLHNITEDKDASNPYYSCPGYFAYCLPCEWVKEPEKKYRPFSLNEFTELYAIGNVVTYRLKDCEVIEQSMLIGCQSGNDEDAPGISFVLIGNCRYSLQELFNKYELKYLNHWQPFGVIDEDKE